MSSRRSTEPSGEPRWLRLLKQAAEASNAVKTLAGFAVATVVVVVVIFRGDITDLIPGAGGDAEADTGTPSLTVEAQPSEQNVRYGEWDGSKPASGSESALGDVYELGVVFPGSGGERCALEWRVQDPDSKRFHPGRERIACDDKRDFRTEVLVLVPEEGESYRVRFRLLDDSGTPRATAWTEAVGIF
jgi:hypothetical protein